MHSFNYASLPPQLQFNHSTVLLDYAHVILWDFFSTLLLKFFFWGGGVDWFGGGSDLDFWWHFLYENAALDIAISYLTFPDIHVWCYICWTIDDHMATSPVPCIHTVSRGEFAERRNYPLDFPVALYFQLHENIITTDKRNINVCLHEGPRLVNITDKVSSCLASKKTIKL